MRSGHTISRNPPKDWEQAAEIINYLDAYSVNVVCSVEVTVRLTACLGSLSWSLT